jgi:hypothetical protein
MKVKYSLIPRTVCGSAVFEKNPSMVPTVGSPRIVRLNGLPAFRFVVRDRYVKNVTHVVFDGPFVYELDLTALPKSWPHVAATLNGVAQTFTVTK